MCGGVDTALLGCTLAEAGRTLSYVETVDSRRADAFHKPIKSLFEEDIRHNYELVVRKAVRDLKLKDVEIAIDTHKSFYWGKHGGLNVRGTKCEQGTNLVWEWIVVSVVKPVSLPLMALPYRQGGDLTSLSIELLEFVKSLKLNVKLSLFDRGFYIGRLIDYLEAKRVKYIILAPQNAAIKRYISQTESIASFAHTISYAYKKSKWKPKTNIVVINDDKRKLQFTYATNLPCNRCIFELYRRRWQIETHFRVAKEAKIKSKSSISIIRYFYFMIQLLLTVTWTMTKKLIHPISFKRYLAKLSQKIYPNIIL